MLYKVFVKIFCRPNPFQEEQMLTFFSFLYTAIHDCHHFTLNWHLTFRFVSEMKKNIYINLKSKE